MPVPDGMIEALGAVTSASVIGLFSVVAHKMRRENSEAHGANKWKMDENRRVLDSIDARTEKMDDKLDDHGEWIAGHKAWHKGRGDNGN